LTTGKTLPPDQPLTNDSKIPVRPFVGKLAPRGELRNYVPSLDPVRVEGKFVEVPKTP
jgi:hypothetical protein